jgi:hypothetical protein
MTPPPPSSIEGKTAAAPERRKQRAPDLSLDLRLGIFVIGHGPDGAADIVDQEIDPAEALLRRAHCGNRAGIGLEVGGDGQGGSTLRLDLDANLVDGRGSINQGDGTAFGGEP